MSTKINLGKPGKFAGFVRAIKSMNPDRAPAFAVEIFSPITTANKQTQWFSSYKVGHNRELVFMSLLRDALVHSLPVEIQYDSLRQIVSVDVRTRHYFEQGIPKKINGNIIGIRINEYGLGKENWEIYDLATVQIDNIAEGKLLYLNLQRADKETKTEQLALLQYAYNNKLEAEITYQEISVNNQFSVKNVKLQSTLPFITSIQIGKVHGDFVKAAQPKPKYPGDIGRPPSTSDIKKAGSDNFDTTPPTPKKPNSEKRKP